MSMKRTKQGGAKARDNNTSTDFWAKPVEPEKSWAELTEGKADETFVPYVVSQKYNRGQFILHPKFGKGVVVDSDALRVEILFEGGKKKFGHGQA